MDSFFIQLPEPYSSKVNIKFDYNKDNISSYVNGKSTDN